MGLRPDESSPQTQPNGLSSVDAAKEKIVKAMEQGFVVFEWVHRRFDGEDFWVEVQVFPSIIGKNEKVLLVGWREIGRRKALEREKENLRHGLLFQAYTDSLTGLKNRRALEKFINDYIDKDPNHEQHFFLYYIDLDNFKTINDAFGRAGIADVTALDGIETHDCFAMTEYMAIDHFGITPPGEAWRAIESGQIDPSGSLPINTSGGLIGCGHPVGATGARMLFDAAKQVCDEAGAIQIEGARRIGTLNIGGSCATVASFVVGCDP